MVYVVCLVSGDVSAEKNSEVFKGGLRFLCSVALHFLQVLAV